MKSPEKDVVFVEELNRLRLESKKNETFFEP